MEPTLTFRPTHRDRPTSGRAPSGWPWGAIGMVVLLVICESFVARCCDGFADPAAMDWNQGRKRAAKDARAARVLCFGDSQVKLGVVPRVIQDRTGLRSYNLALIGGQPLSSYYLLRRALAGGARPAAIVVDFLPPLLAMDLKRNHRNIPELLTLGESAELAWEEQSADAFFLRSIEMLIPSVKTRNDLRAVLMLALQGKPAVERGDPSYRRNWRTNQGAMLLPAYTFTEDPELWYRVNYPEPWTCSPLHAAYVRRFLDLAFARGIAVYWLLHPIGPEAQEYCEARGQEARVEQFVRAAVERYSNLIVVDGRHSGYRNSEFVDTVHLHARTAAVLSESLADVLVRPPGRSSKEPRWVTLPHYPGRPSDVPLETLAESRQILERAGVIRR
jgi:hypothetical protein